jgi:hypothetical protein
LAGGFSGQSKQIHTVELMTPDEIAKFFSRQSGRSFLSGPKRSNRTRPHAQLRGSFFAGKCDP